MGSELLIDCQVLLNDMLAKEINGAYLHFLHTAVCSLHQVGWSSTASTQKLSLPLCGCHELLGKLSWAHILFAPTPHTISHPCTSDTEIGRRPDSVQSHRLRTWQNKDQHGILSPQPSFSMTLKASQLDQCKYNQTS